MAGAREVAAYLAAEEKVKASDYSDTTLLSHELLAIAPVFEGECDATIDAWYRCKAARGNDPRACLDASNDVTDCLRRTHAAVRASCDKQFVTYSQCLDWKSLRQHRCHGAKYDFMMCAQKAGLRVVDHTQRK